jgi:DNA invertase Pin-like site-specific DNA recombinase
MSTPPARLHTDQALEAAGYIRVSRKLQADGYSPETQRARIRQLAKEQGFLLDPARIFEDHERGSKVTRVGYQAVIDLVRAGTAHAVLVFMFDRFGRDGAEWLARAREFERLGVPIISAQEGKDEGGLIRFVRAGMAEQFSRDLAKKTTPNREAAARRGTHMGQTPYGYRRVYPPRESSDRLPAGQLVVDDGPAGKAWVVRELFARYAAGGTSLATLASWCSTDPRVGPPPGLAFYLARPQKAERGEARPLEAWTSRGIGRILRNPAYKGAVRFNQIPQGLYERAAPGSAFQVEDAHPPLVPPDVWDTVQHRLSSAGDHSTYNRTHTPSGRGLSLGSGLIHCQDCGGPMHVVSLRATPRYLCTHRMEARPCQGPQCRAVIVHAALLAEVRRLRGAPWTPRAEHRLLRVGGAGDVERTAHLATALDEALRRRRNNLALIEAIDAPTPDEIAAFRDRGAEISAQIATLQAQLQDAEQTAAALPNLRTLHTQLTRTEIAGLVNAAVAQNNAPALRTLVLSLVDSARIVDRRPHWNPTWVRLAVTWTADVQTLLDAGLLRLDAAPDGPPVRTPAEKHAEQQARYQATRKALYPQRKDAMNAARREERRARRDAAHDMVTAQNEQGVVTDGV